MIMIVCIYRHCAHSCSSAFVGLRIDLKIKVYHLYQHHVNNSNNNKSNNDHDNNNNRDNDDDDHHKHDDDHHHHKHEDEDDDDKDYNSIRTAPCTQPNFYAVATTGKS
jgi:hypothetical protein